MQIHHKPRLDKGFIYAFLAKQWPQPIVKLESLVEGEDSQVLYFESNNLRYVLRINKSDYGFKKDAYMYEHFASTNVPIPKIQRIGKVDTEYAYCISEFVAGTTIQDLDRATVETLLPTTLEMLKTIRDVDISRTSGYGEIGLSGNGRSASWQEWLLTHIQKPDFDWNEVIEMGALERTFFDKIADTFRQLVDQVPNERKLIHGDFSSNNVLVKDSKIVAILDWDSASYGDWLFDVAGAYYWRNHLMCMDVQANFFEQQLASLPNYQARVTCYQMRAALIEIYVQAHRGEQQKLKWHIKRCHQLLGQ